MNRRLLVTLGLLVLHLHLAGPLGNAQTAEEPTTPSSSKPEKTEDTAAGSTVTAQNDLPATEVTGTTEDPWSPVEGYKASYSSTATKSDIPILDVPASIQVVPRQVIEDQKATRLWEAVRNVSGVQNSGSAGNRSDGFVIRGFDSGRLLKDGFQAPFSFGDVGFIGLSNIERVEVLKGPASVLYGQKEPGGAINLVTKKPMPETFYDFDFTYGSYDFYRAEADLNQPLAQDGSLLFRLNTEYQNSDSFRDLFTNFERFQIAPSLRWMPGPDTTIDLQLEYYDQQAPADRGTVAIDDDAFALPRERFLGEAYDINRADDLRLSALIDHDINADWNWRTSLRGTWANTAPVASYPFGLLEGSDRLIERAVFDFIQEIDYYAAQTNLNGKFDTGSIGHNVLIGADANFTRFESWNKSAPVDPIDAFRPVYGAPPQTYTPRSHQDRRFDFYGLYLQDLVSFTEQWKLLLGGRYDYVDSYFARDGVASVDSVDREFSPRAGLVYQPVPDLSLYASYTESFQPSAFSSNFNGTPFEPEMAGQYEVGVKRDWFGGRLSTTLAVFELTKSNVATQDPGNPLFSIQTGEQRSRGVELDIHGELAPGWNVFASLAYLDTELTEDNDFPVGNRLPNAPEWSGSLWTSYAIQGGPLHGLEFGGGLFGIGDRMGSLTNELEVEGYLRFDAFARYRITENFSVALNVENLFDENYIEGISGDTVVVPGAPRSFFLTASLSF